MLAVIGCGNPNRRDDGVGVLVAQRLAERLARHPVPGVRAFDCGTAGMEVMFAARGCDALVIVDASQSGSEPGAIYEVPGEELASLKDPTFSLHDFRWDHALAAGKKIFADDFPSEVTVFLVEAESTGFGLELSPAVEAAADKVFDRVLERVAAHAAARYERKVDVSVTIKRGSLHVPVALYEQAFDGRDGAVLVPQGGHLRVMPVEQVAGGVLVKIRNGKGDRALDVTDAIRALGWDDWGEVRCRVTWDRELGALDLTPIPDDDVGSPSSATP